MIKKENSKFLGWKILAVVICILMITTSITTITSASNKQSNLSSNIPFEVNHDFQNINSPEK